MFFVSGMRFVPRFVLCFSVCVLFLGLCVCFSVFVSLLGVSVVLGVGGPGDRVAWGGPEQTAVQFSAAVALRYHVCLHILRLKSASTWIRAWLCALPMRPPIPKKKKGQHASGRLLEHLFMTGDLRTCRTHGENSSENTFHDDIAKHPNENYHVHDHMMKHFGQSQCK